MPETPLRILHLEDDVSDAELALHELRRGGLVFEARRVETRQAFLAALAEFRPDLILSDYRLPEFDGMQALLLAQERVPDVPVIITTGSVNEETAVACLKAGAADYVLKEQLGRLGAAVRGALEMNRLAVEKRATEDRVRRLNRLLRTISEVNHLVARATSEESLLKGVCRILVSHDDYALAWIGRAEPGTMRVVPVASAGAEVGLLDEIDVRWDDTPAGRGPTGTAIREGRPLIVSDLQADAMVGPWRDQMLRHGLHSDAALPIRRGGALTACLTVYAAEKGFIDEEEFVLLRGLAEDLSFALDALDGRDRIRKTGLELRKLWQAVEQSPATVVITDLAGRIEYVNPQFTVSTGYTAEEATGQNPSILKSGQTPPEVYRVLWETISSGRVWRGEMCNRKKDGTLFWEEASISPIRDEHGVATSYVAVKEDITDRKRTAEALVKSEAYFRSIIENALDVVAVLDFDGVVHYASLSVEPTFGYKPEQLVGRSVFEFIHPDDKAIVGSRLQEIRNGAGPTKFEVRFEHRDGSWRPLSVLGNRLPAEAGVDRLVINARDLTERVNLEEQYRQAQKMEAVGRLAGGVAHDFNNLLTVIQGYGEMLAESLEGDAEKHETVGEIVKAAGRAAALTRQLLAFSRQQILELRVLDIGDVVAETEKMLKRLIGEDIEVRVVKPQALERVKADPGQITQVLLNLAVNARDAMPGGGRLTVELSNVSLDAPLGAAPEAIPAGRYVLMSMTDTGCGMDAGTLGHLFEPFFTTKARGKGTGLGLATVYGIVRQSGGYIAVWSAPGAGTTFRTYWPRCDELVGSALRSSIRSLRGTETVLLVEDEPSVRGIAQAMLRKQGYTVLVAEDGDAALGLLARDPRPVHVLLTDVVMPGMNGRELASRVVAARPAVKAVLMSGYTADVLTRAEETGIAGFLPKPFSERTLSAKIREVLDAPSARDPVGPPAGGVVS